MTERACNNFNAIIYNNLLRYHFLKQIKEHAKVLIALNLFLHGMIPVYVIMICYHSE